MDNNDIALLHRQLFIGRVEIPGGDELPFFLRDGHDNAGAEETLERHLVHEGRALHDVRRGIDVGAVMGGHFNAGHGNFIALINIKKAVDRGLGNFRFRGWSLTRLGRYGRGNGNFLIQGKGDVKVLILGHDKCLLQRHYLSG